MNGSGRKYTSKWDLKEDSHLYHKDVQGDMLRAKHGEPTSRNRGNEDYGNNMKLTTRSAVDGDHTREISPRLEDYSRRDRTCSPRNSFSRSLRSRSRSPVHGFGRHLEYNDRIRRRPGLSTQLCKDFAVGRCKRGSYCQYSHDNNGGHETAEMEDSARRYHNYSVAGDHYPRSDRSTEICNRFLKGQCLRGSSCKYLHDTASNAYSQGSTDEMFRERESNRSNRYRTYERDERGSGSVPCRYFAAGNCRNGRYCRFSHGHPALSPDRRSRDHNLDQHHSVDAAEKVFKEPKWSDPDNSVSEVVTLRENRNEKISDEEQKVSCWSMDEARDSSFNNDNNMLAVQNERHSNFDKSERKVFQLENEATGSSVNVSGTRGSVSLPVETTMSPFWNYNVQASTQPFEQELKTGNEEKVHVNSKVATENVVCGEQLNQLSNLSTTLAQLIANGQQLPQIYASLNSHIPVDMPSFANSEEAVQPVPHAPSLSNPATVSKQYDPISDSENLELPSINNQHSTLLAEPVACKNSAAIPNTKQVSLDNAPKSGGVENNHNLQKDICSESYNGNHNLNPVEGLANSAVTRENDRVGAHQSDKHQDDEKVIDDGPLENENTVNKVEEGKKGKNLKGIRPFKFALVEVVKELLKPAWKEGKIDKEVHKIIVKKAVDKVTGALQEVNIPQTKEKIDNYLSSSKPKLTKLVEAYVEKFHKSKPEPEAA